MTHSVCARVIKIRRDRTEKLDFSLSSSSSSLLSREARLDSLSFLRQKFIVIAIVLHSFARTAKAPMI